MSEATGFDPALLEGKDRAELAAIAESLGQKPGARAKKADIVTLIMRLVGADGPEGEEAPAGDSGSPAAAGEPDAGASPGTGGPEDAEGGEEGPRRSQGAPRGRGQQGRDERDRGGEDDDGRNGGAAEQGARSDQGSGTDQGSAADQGGGADRGDDEASPEEPEPGNRRRRRRGRDRDRSGDDQVQGDPVEVEGLVDLREEGYGFLRLQGFHPSRDDAYISVKQTRQFGLRTGDVMKGKSRPPGRNEKNPALLQVEVVNGHPAHHQPARPRFEDLTPRFPSERLTLELADDPAEATVRIVDLLAPIGKGQRGLVVAHPGSGATTALKHIVRSIEVNHPDVELLVLLIDERPEEVTDMERWLLRGTVAASTFDRSPAEHVAVAELLIEHAKRLVEAGRDVVVVVDGITRLARSHTLAGPGSGRTVGGDLDVEALQAAKRFLGAARCPEEGGSLTLLATVAAGTGRAGDEIVLEQARGAATMELVLDDRLATLDTFPAVDVDASGTRHGDLLVDRAQVDQVTALRKALSERGGAEGPNRAGLALLLERIAASTSNAALLAEFRDG